jgi:hypothetical protein
VWPKRAAKCRGVDESCAMRGGGGGHVGPSVDVGADGDEEFDKVRTAVGCGVVDGAEPLLRGGEVRGGGGTMLSSTKLTSTPWEKRLRTASNGAERNAACSTSDCI